MQMVVFSIRKDIAERYYYKVDLMKRFFLELIQKPDSIAHVRQLLYITESFPFSDWVVKHSPLKEGVKRSLSNDVPFLKSSSSYGIIDNKNYCCLFQCENLWQAEAMVLEPLRRSSHSFYIIETKGEHYGWLSPLAGQRLLM